jgi:hypothetical protein
MFQRKNQKIMLIVALTIALLLAISSFAMAAVWTDQADYAPGSLVTISGDNSDNAGYLAGETVVVKVVGPNGYTAECDALVGDGGAWSCTVTLWESDLAVGEYSYTATGQTSGVSQSGTFTDAITIDSIDPNQGPITGGTEVKFTGNGFSDGDIVTFGGIQATNVYKLINDLYATTPAHAVGTVDVVVSKGTQSTTLANGFTYVGKITPTITWANPADIVYGIALSSTQLNATASVEGAFVYTPAAGTILNAGSNQTLHVDFTPTDTTNYNNASNDVTINVLKAPATVTADNKSKNYGDDNPTLTATVVGEVEGGDAINYSLSTTATKYSNVGTYSIVVTLGSNPNYNVTPTDGTLTINKKDASVTADDKSKTYGDDNPTLTATVVGEVEGGDAINYSLSTTATKYSNVSTYSIVVTLGSNPNYNVTKTDGTLTINKATLTVTADDKTMVLHAALPSFSFTYAGFKGSDGPGDIDMPPTCSTTATSSDPVGSYPITCSGGLDNNYDFFYKPGTLTILYAVGGMCYGGPSHQILQPINWDGSSVFKQKSTVPAKFRVCDYYGNSIGTPGVVTDFKLMKVVSGIETTSPNEDVVSTTPYTEFRWSAVDQQWIFNISTKSLSANKTYYYEITLDDGSIIEFHFGLK